jgi:isoleucyl-tRNA synthetase
VVALDTVLTPALIAEGLARDVVRHVQVLRKEADLRVEQHIALGVTTQSAELVEAVNQFRVHAMDETLAHRLVVNEPLAGTIASKDVTEGDITFTISIADVK